ncbi:MAG: hypothetical protein K2N94_13765 [Lachnospiraceae bacterium]|nr:hypothetical protein [Lachnospiraceae bacterium]
MEQILAVLDREEAYITRLLGYFHQQEAFAGITAAAFTREESFQRYAETHTIGLLLCEAELYYALERKPDCRTVLLAGQGCVREDGPPVIFRFQSAQEILDELMAYYQELQPERRGRASPGTRIWTVCGIGCGGDTTLAYALAKKKSRDKKIFYLSLDPFYMPAASGARSSALTEAIYFIKQNSNEIKEHIAKLIRKCERVDCLYGVSHWADISECTSAELAALLEAVAGLEKYDCVIVDAGGFTDASAGAMEQSEYIVLIGRGDRRTAEREQELVRQAEAREPDFSERLVRLRLADEASMLAELSERLP